MKTWKWPALIVLAQTIALLLSGCNSMETFDAQGYVQGVLDSQYKNNHVKYLELVEATQEEAEQNYWDGIDVEAGFFAESFLLDPVSDEVQQEIVDFYSQVYPKSKYEVKKANVVEGGFTVEVVISPIDIISISSADIDSFIEDFSVKNEAGEFSEMTDEEFAETFNQGVMEILKGKLSQIGYEADKSIVVQIKKGADDLYGMSDEDFQNIDELIIAY